SFDGSVNGRGYRIRGGVNDRNSSAICSNVGVRSVGAYDNSIGMVLPSKCDGGNDRIAGCVNDGNGGATPVASVDVGSVGADGNARGTVSVGDDGSDDRVARRIYDCNSARDFT